MRRSARRRGAAICVAAIVLATSAPASATTGTAPLVRLAESGWDWPLDGFRLAEPYVQPAHRYGSGHRGIDLDPVADGDVRAPEGGVVAFSGMVAGRGILTIDHGDGLVTTLEPVSTTLAAGVRVERGEVVAALSTGGHTAPGLLHVGVRLDGEYINPMLLLGGVPRAVLLPCC